MALTMDPPIAVALIVDASLMLASQWQTHFPAYVVPLLRRLSDTHPSYKLLLGFLCYATADTRPSPILCKRYFHEFSVTTKMLRDEFGKVGIGSCGSGKGMAALEALTCALEMFEVLTTSYTPSDPSRAAVCHIIHITASHVDDAVNPRWNDNEAFDNMTWDTLPVELKKRKIHYSCISLGVDVPHLVKLHGAFENKVTPWFPVPAASHTILLSGYLPQKIVPTKRAPEPTQDKLPDAKRQRTTQPAEVPSTTSAPPPPPLTSNVTPPVPPAQPSVVPPIPTSAPNLTAPANPLLANLFANPNNRPMDLIDRYRVMEAKMRQIRKAAQDLRAAGDIQRSDAMNAEINKALPNYTKLKGLVHAMMNEPFFASQKLQFVQRLTNGPPIPTTQPLGMPGPSSMGPGGVGGINTGAPSVSPASGPPPHSMPNFTPPQGMGHGRAPSGEFAPMMMPNHPPSMGVPGPSSSPPNAGLMMPQQPQQPQPTQPENKPPGHPVWHGPLCWSGIDNNNGKREVKAFIAAYPQNSTNCFVETWPDAFMLTPTQQPAVSMPDMQLWAKKTQPALCVLAPQAKTSVVDKATNDAHFKSLVSLLLTKKVFAVATWTLPNGSRNPGCLIFPSPNHGLLGAFFPKNGIPEMPKPTVMGQIPPQIEQHLQKLSPEDRNLFLSRYMARMKQIATAGGGGPGAGAGVGPPNFGGMSNGGGSGMMPGMQNMASLPFNMPQQGGGMNPGSMPAFVNQQQQQAPGFNNGMNMMNMGLNFNQAGNPGAGMQQQQGAGMPRPMAPGMNGFSNEILQSFMQRNQEGQGG